MTDKKLEHRILRLSTDIIGFGHSPIRNLLAAALELEICQINAEIYSDTPEEQAKWEQAIVEWTANVKHYASKL